MDKGKKKAAPPNPTPAQKKIEMNADDWISMLQGKTSENYQKQIEEEKKEREEQEAKAAAAKLAEKKREANEKKKSVQKGSKGGENRPGG